MLPAYIIEELLKRRKREKLSSEELFIECPKVEGFEPAKSEKSDGEEVSDRGIAIIDFSI
jgi:hypothetical protein